jgi:5-methylthioadenosine/S-adenosylhomocysteine deaminase
MKAGIVTGMRNQPARDAVTPHSDGIILPGPIDLHGHPEFNVFARREPPRAYVIGTPGGTVGEESSRGQLLAF